MYCCKSSSVRFRIWFQNLWKLAPCSGLVKKSPSISPVQQYSMLTSLDSIQSVTKKYCILMCCMCLLLDCFPFFSRSIMLWLSWNTSLSDTVYPCASRKFQVHRTCGITSSMATSSTSVELFVLSFCHVKVTNATPLPSDMTPPVWLLMSLCTANAPSTHHLMQPLSSALWISGRCFIPCRYFIVHVSFL